MENLLILDTCQAKNEPGPLRTHGELVWLTNPPTKL